MGFKITDYPAKTAFDDGDLYDVSSYDGVSAYTSEKMTFAQLKSELGMFYSADGSLTSTRVVTLSASNYLSFEGGQTTFKGEDSTTSNFVAKFKNSSNVDSLVVRNDGQVYVNAAITGDEGFIVSQKSGASGNDIIRARDENGDLVHDFNKGNKSFYNQSNVLVHLIHGTAPSFCNTGNPMIYGATTSINNNDSLYAVGKTGSSSNNFTFRAETEARALSFYVRNDGYCLQALKTAAITDASLDDSSFSFYFSGNDLIIKAKDSGSTVRTLNLGTLT